MGNPHPYKVSCQGILAQVYDKTLEANIDVELLQEILHYYHRRSRLEFGLDLFDRLTALFPDPYPVTLGHAAAMREVLARHPSLQVRDALHAAVVMEAGLEGIISADRGFDAIPEIERFDPAEL